MDEIKKAIAKNISELRRKNGLTQAGLAQKLNYSDKAISKWERGESVPDIAVLKTIADLFSVSVDYLLSEEHTPGEAPVTKKSRRITRNRLLITAISIVTVFAVATIAFVNVDLFASGFNYHWLIFVSAVPIASIVALVFNSIWFYTKFNFIIVSVLVWSILAVAFLWLLMFVGNFWQLFVLGVPAQIIILLWSRIRVHHKRKKK